MRMWMVDPKGLCLNHLLGEHVECHMFVGTINKGMSLHGYLSRGLVAPQDLCMRHQQLADEMVRRGFHHNSPLPAFATKDFGVVDSIANMQELLRRCQKCKF